MVDQAPEHIPKPMNRRDFLKLSAGVGGLLGVTAFLGRFLDRFKYTPPEISSLKGSAEIATQSDLQMKVAQQLGIDTATTVVFKLHAENSKGHVQSDFLIVRGSSQEHALSQPQIYTLHNGEAVQLKMHRYESNNETVFRYESDVPDVPAFIYVAEKNGDMRQFNYFPSTPEMQSLVGKEVDWNQTPGAPIIPERTPDQIKTNLPGIRKPAQITK